MNSRRVDIAFRYSALGDLVLCSAFVKKHAQVTDAPLYLVTQPDFAELVQNHFPAHPELHVRSVFLKGWQGLKQAAQYGFHLGREVFAKHHPSEINVYDLHDVPKSRAFAVGLWWGLISSEVKVRIFRNPKHSLLRQLSILFGRDLLGARWVYLEHQELLDTTVVCTPELTKVNSQSQKRILLAPAASRWKKEWPFEEWKSLIETLTTAAPDYELCVVAPAKHKPTLELKNTLGTKYPRIVWNTTLAIGELPTIAANAALCICSNSAWLHLAEAVATPVIALEGPIVKGFGFSPWMNRSVSLEISDLKCRPCSKHGGGACKLSGKDFHACMKRILPTHVANTALAILGEREHRS